MARGDAASISVYTSLIEQLLSGAPRSRRARVYAEAAVSLGGARRAVVTWRRRAGVFALSHSSDGGELVKRQYPKESAADDGYAATLDLREGQVCVEGSAWIPGEVEDARDLLVLLPEGTSAGAPRIFIAGADPEALEPLHQLLRSLRPHWIEKRTLRRRASIDHLTGTYNFRYLRRYLKQLCGRSRKNGSRFSILMLDVDRLREYNSEFGHLMGSRVLAQLGRVLLRVIRDGDFVAKYGGDEFLIVLQDASKANAVDIALRFKDAISRQAFQGVPAGYITCSIGVATFGEDGATFQSLVAAADHATYAAKDRGRNTVVAAGREKTTETRRSTG